jgi:hypothetical protein
MAIFMVERDLRGITMEALGAAQGAAIAQAKSCTSQGTPVRYVRSLFTPEDGRCRCLFEAATADAVRTVNDAAKLPYERIVEAMDLAPPA